MSHPVVGLLPAAGWIPACLSRRATAPPRSRCPLRVSRPQRRASACKSAMRPWCLASAALCLPMLSSPRLLPVSTHPAVPTLAALQATSCWWRAAWSLLPLRSGLGMTSSRSTTPSAAPAALCAVPAPPAAAMQQAALLFGAAAGQWRGRLRGRGWCLPAVPHVLVPSRQSLKKSQKRCHWALQSSRKLLRQPLLQRLPSRGDAALC